MKIHSEEVMKDGFDDIPLAEIREMVGFVEPLEDGTWDVKNSDDGGFICSTQEIAHIMAGIEEIKAKLFR